MLMKTAIMYLACFLTRLNGGVLKIAFCVARSGLSEILKFGVCAWRFCGRARRVLRVCERVLKFLKFGVSRVCARCGAQFASRLGRMF